MSSQGALYKLKDLDPLDVYFRILSSPGTMDPFSLPMKVIRVSWGWWEGTAVQKGGDS